MRISVSKQQHRAALENLARQLGGDHKDAFEHVMNCWIVGQLPAQSQAPSNPALTPQPTDDNDELSGLADWS
jgi:hypothetical protein